MQHSQMPAICRDEDGLKDGCTDRAKTDRKRETLARACGIQRDGTDDLICEAEIEAQM